MSSVLCYLLLLFYVMVFSLENILLFVELQNFPFSSGFNPRNPLSFFHLRLYHLLAFSLLFDNISFPRVLCNLLCVLAIYCFVIYPLLFIALFCVSTLRIFLCLCSSLFLYLLCFLFSYVSFSSFLHLLSFPFLLVLFFRSFRLQATSFPCNNKPIDKVKLL